MTDKEALELRALVNVTTQNMRVRIYRIGNGEHVLIINGYFFIWSYDDWEKNRLKLLRANARPVGKKITKEFDRPMGR
jgi:hypothetical protein